jgi:hypothetical protein
MHNKSPPSEDALTELPILQVVMDQEGDVDGLTECSSDSVRLLGIDTVVCCQIDRYPPVQVHPYRGPLIKDIDDDIAWQAVPMLLDG